VSKSLKSDLQPNYKMHWHFGLFLVQKLDWRP